MLGYEVHTNFCAVLVWEMQEPQKKTASVKKCSDYANASLWDYPFGLTMPERSSNIANPNDNYKFTGHEKDDEGGLDLYHANARGYDPVLGRFMHIDPLASQFPAWNPYHYVYNNPMKFIDPTGLKPTGQDPEKSKLKIVIEALQKLEDWYVDEDGNMAYNSNIKNQEDLDNAGISGTYVGEEALDVDESGNLVFLNSDGSKTSTAGQESKAGAIMAGTFAISAGLIVDDVTVIGIANDPAIPFIIAGGALAAGGVWLWAKSNPGKNDPHGDSGRALEKADKQIEALQRQMQGANRNVRKKLKDKINNIRNAAQKKRKGETHHKN